MLSRGAPLRILLESVSRSKVSKKVSSHLRMLLAKISDLAFVSDESPLGPAWVFVHQRENVKSAHLVVEPAPVTCSATSHFE